MCGQLALDFIVSSRYKLLPGPYGTGFFWARSELIERMQLSGVYWRALEGTHKVYALSER